MLDKKILVFFILGMVGGILGLVATARLVWHGKYYPGVYVGKTAIGGMKRSAGATKVEQAISEYQLNLTYNGTSWQVPKEVVTFEAAETTSRAYRMGRRLKIEDYVAVILGREEKFPVVSQLNESAMNAWVDEITATVEINPVYARVEVEKGKVRVINGNDGVILDRERLKEEINGRVSVLDDKPIEIPMREVVRELNEAGLKELQAKGERILGDKLEIKQDDEKITLTQEKLARFLVDEGAIRTYTNSLSTLLNRPPRDAKFEFAEGRVKEFAPSRDGVEVKIEETTVAIREAMTKLLQDSKEERIEVVVIKTAPKITTEMVNNLGIEERIGRGESYYAHSIANRVYNIGLAAGRVSGALIAPGEEFSFNKFVGEISSETGYKTAYVISGGRTVLGDGGGVCQVSTTLFRAVMDAGLPITERWAHAYRVGYYEQNSPPGIDATVFSPSKDFKFKNDTPGHILIQAINDPKNVHLVFEIYGTKDGRIATISKPVVTGVSPPPPDIYEDDPNLPTGTLKQVDWAAWGAKASFNYKVVKADGSTLFEKTYASNYRPWADIFIRGTGPVAQQ